MRVTGIDLRFRQAEVTHKSSQYSTLRGKVNSHCTECQREVSSIMPVASGIYRDRSIEPKELFRDAYRSRLGR